jgi:hypothetical protein
MDEYTDKITESLGNGIGELKNLNSLKLEFSYFYSIKKNS